MRKCWWLGNELESEETKFNLWNEWMGNGSFLDGIGVVIKDCHRICRFNRFFYSIEAKKMQFAWFKWISEQANAQKPWEADIREKLPRLRENHRIYKIKKRINAFKRASKTNKKFSLKNLFQRSLLEHALKGGS